MPRRDMMLADKIALLDQIESLPPGTSNRRVSEITGVPKSTLARVIRNRDTLRQQWALRPGSHQRRRRFGKNPDVEEALNQWFTTVSELGVPVSGAMIKCMSEELAKQMGHEDFKATDGWVSRWKVRNSIRLKKPAEEKDVDSAEVMDASELTLLLQKYRADNIYSVDEMGLFYRATPDGSLNCNFTLSSSLSAMDQLTVLCCCNMSGNDKRKLLVVGKSSECACFRGFRMSSLPVLYRSEANGMMTSTIFKQWLTDWDEELQLESRKIILFLNRCVAHPNFGSLRNIRLEFLPSDTTSFMQPMGMGVTKKLKMLYRDKIVNYVLEAIEEGVLTSSSTAEEVSTRIDLLQAMQFLADIWRKIDSKSIQNCFLQSGFKHPGLEMYYIPECESDCFLGLQRVKNYEEFVSIDNDLQYYYENEEGADALASEAIAVLRNVEDDSPVIHLVTDKDARRCIAKLQRYFMQECNEDSPMSSLNECADFVHSQSAKKEEAQHTH